MDMVEFNDNELDWLIKKLVSEKTKNIYLAREYNFDFQGIQP